MNEPITSYHTGLKRLHNELLRQLTLRKMSPVQLREVIAWYFSYGYSLSYSRKDMEELLSDNTQHREIASTLSEVEIKNGKPAQEFSIGESVEVMVSAKNTTYHCGRIIQITWHHKESKWHYFIEENGKKVSKRYEGKSLRNVCS
jgi:hypothetical protein